MSSAAASFVRRHGRWILLALGVVALAVAWTFLPVRDWIERFHGWIEARGPVGYALLVLAYALATVLFVPGSVLTLAAGLTFGLGVGFAVVSAGSTLGAGCAFLLARYFLRDRVQRVADDHENFAAVDEAIGEQGWKMVALLRLSPLLPFNLSNYLYGVTRVEFWPYLAASWVGMLPGTLLYVYLGATGRQATAGGDASVWRWTLFGVGLVATVAVTLWISHLAQRAVSERK